MLIKTYSELILLPTFKERYEYLRMGGCVGRETFGFDRYLNQAFYQHSREWKRVRDIVITRDNGCDLGIPGREIYGRIIIHHLNQVLPEDLRDRNSWILDPEYLISTSHETHQAIHYGDKSLLMTAPVERTRNDTCPWRKDY